MFRRTSVLVPEIPHQLALRHRLARTLVVRARDTLQDKDIPTYHWTKNAAAAVSPASSTLCEKCRRMRKSRTSGYLSSSSNIIAAVVLRPTAYQSKQHYGSS